MVQAVLANAVQHSVSVSKADHAAMALGAGAMRLHHTMGLLAPCVIDSRGVATFDSLGRFYVRHERRISPRYRTKPGVGRARYDTRRARVAETEIKAVTIRPRSSGARDSAGFSAAIPLLPTPGYARHSPGLVSSSPGAIDCRRSAAGQNRFANG